jgi:hypothetical protein
MGKELLLIDGVVNLLLGIVLLSYPKALARAFGLPSDGRPFFALILGGVLFGVGLALIIERYRPPLRVVGLGLGGAVAINLCGAVVLIGWLLVGQPTLTELGRLSLWVLVVLLLGLSAFELYAHLRRAEE